nr:uncharacterized protein LOC129532016 [Gorilla gorilla gorilla]XP_055236009.1 uncharacterized protein LOC129532017 [Gorilla gorilla gorilla]
MHLSRCPQPLSHGAVGSHTAGGGTIQFQENKLNTPTDSTLCRFLRPSICLTVDPPSQAPNLSAASTHPAPACQWPLQAHGAHSSQQPFQSQFFPSGGLSGLRTSSSRPLQTHLHPPGVLSGPSSSSWLRLQARLLPLNNLFGLSAYPSPGVLGRPTASSSQAPQAQVRPHGAPSTMSSCPPMAPAGPKWSPVGGLLHAKLGPPGDLCRPKLS